MNYDTAYGSTAEPVRDLLLSLDSPDPKISASAACDLDSFLCHQHVMIHSASLPAVEFILEVLERVTDLGTLQEITHLLGGLSETTHPKWLKANLRDPTQIPEWTIEIRRRLRQELPRFEVLSRYPDACVVEEADCILRNLAD